MRPLLGAERYLLELTSRDCLSILPDELSVARKLQLCMRKVGGLDLVDGTARVLLQLQLQVAKSLVAAGEPCPAELVFDSIRCFLGVVRLDGRDSVE
jgi:hypothetical protein